MEPEPLRLMAVHAHPDDESIAGGATTARYAAEGVDVLVVTCTGGERGEILNPTLDDQAHLLANLPAVRRKEMAAAARTLGVGHHWLGFLDSGSARNAAPPPEGSFASFDLHAAAAQLVEVMRRFRPHVVTTYDDNGGYSRHPDHVMTNRITVTAFDHAHNAATYPDCDLWQPLKLYYHRSFHRPRFHALDQALRAEGLRSPYRRLLESWTDPLPRITTVVPCGDYFQQRNDAIGCHQTQIDPRFWFAPPVELEQRIWPTEQFELLRSHVDTSIPETDLFSGVRDTVDQIPVTRRGGR